MLYLKKYFTEGLIQMTILLSLCGVRVDVGLQSYLPPSWHEMILGPTSALTQTQFHNLRNSLEDGHDLNYKSVDVDSFFTTRRLLGWVHSLDRLQVPQAELETWLVQREPDPIPMGCLDQPSSLERAPVGLERDQSGLPVEPGAGPDTLQEEEEADDKELSDVGRRQDLEPLPIEPLLFPIMPTDNPLDLELHWQDLFAIMEPENKDFDMMSSFDHTSDSRPSETLQFVRSEAQNPNFINLTNVEADQEAHLSETSLQHGLLGSLRQSEQVLLPLTPSAELDDQSSVFNNSNVNTLQSPPDYMNVSAEGLSEDFCMVLNAEDNSSTFNMNLLAQDLEDNMEDSPCLQYAPYPENLGSSDVNLYSCDLTPSRTATSLEGNDVSQDLLTFPSNFFLIDKEDFENEDNLHSPLDDLLEDVDMLDEIRLLDLALDEGYSPEMAARLEEESYLDSEITQQKTGRDEDHSLRIVTGGQSQPRRPQQDGDDEADSDSGLSLDFSHSPASPCSSEVSSCSSSTSSTSDSSSSCVSAVGSPFSNDRNDYAETGLVDSDMEVEVTIKHEEEEEMGAVGGCYPDVVKKVFPCQSANYRDHKLFNGFSWQEHVDHDHTYNQPRFSGSSISTAKMPTKHTKSSPPHNTRPYHCSCSRHISKTNVWSRDERHAQALKIPFSNELIVNLPVDEFNDLLTNYKLNEDQVALIRDIRRRGKNKIAAQNCRKRKLDVVLELENDVFILRRHHSRLLREKQEFLRKLHEIKHELGTLYQEVFSRLCDGNERPLDSTEYLIHFGPSEERTLLPLRGGKNSKKQRDKKK